MRLSNNLNSSSVYDPYCINCSKNTSEVWINILEVYQYFESLHKIQNIIVSYSIYKDFCKKKGLM